MNWIERAQEYGHWAITRVGDKPNLHEANLHGANLHGADLRCANLHEANLHGANLHGADLREATGFHPLVHTDHGYRVDASWRGREWRIVAGCRDFSVSEARAHWGDPDYHTPSSGSRICFALDWLETQPTPDIAGGEMKQ